MLVAGFRGNISQKVVESLPVERKYIIPNSLEGVEKFVEFVKKNKPSKVLLFGMYSGKDQDKLRIETFCTNKFRNTIDEESLKVIPIPYFFQRTEKIKLAKGIGNSWCNLASYKLLSTVPKLEYTFLHVPQRHSVKSALEEVLNQIQNESNEIASLHSQ